MGHFPGAFSKVIFITDVLYDVLKCTLGRFVFTICKEILVKKGKGKGHPCTGTEALYRPYGP